VKIVSALRLNPFIVVADCADSRDRERNSCGRRDGTVTGGTKIADSASAAFMARLGAKPINGAPQRKNR